MVPDMIIAIFSFIASILATHNLDILKLVPKIGELGAVSIYFILALIISYPIILFINWIRILIFKVGSIHPKMKFYVMPLIEAIKDGCIYASIHIKNNEDYDIEEFRGTIEKIETLSFPDNNNIFEEEFISNGKNHKVVYEPERYWKEVKKNPDRQVIENVEHIKTVVLESGEEKRFDIARSNKNDGVVILNRERVEHLSGSKKIENKAKITIIFRGQSGDNKIDPIEKVYWLGYSYYETSGMTITRFEELDIDGKKSKTTQKTE